jgi:hypothetical protein
VKKLILLLAAALGGYAVYKKSQQKTGQDLWAQAVDEVPTGDPGR